MSYKLAAFLILFICINTKISFGQLKNVSHNSLVKLSKNELLDSITYILTKTVNIDGKFYSSKNVIFTDHLIDTINGYNQGFVSVDTINLTIRFHFRGTTGSFGFAPYFQLTFYLKAAKSIKWINNIPPELIVHSNYNCCRSLDGDNFPLMMYEKCNGCIGSEDKEGGIPDFTTELNSEYSIKFREDLSLIEKDKISNWFYELISISH